MKKGSFKSSIILSIFLIFFFLFSSVPVIRYISLFFLGVIVLAILQYIFVPRFITVERKEKTLRGIRFQNIEVTIKVRNRSPFPVPYITAADSIGSLFSNSSSFLFGLAPFGSITLTYSCSGHKRGQYILGPVRLEGSDHFGLYRWKKRMESNATVLVYPSIYSLELVNNKGLPAGSLRINNKLYEDVTQFRSLREYVPGDEMKRINWKASAKTGKLYTMDFDATLYFPVLVILNVCRDDYQHRQRESLIERAFEVTASLVFYFANLKQEIGLLSTGSLNTLNTIERGGKYTIVPSRQGYEHAQAILEKLAKMDSTEGSADFQELLFKSGVKIPMGTRIMLISPRVRETQARALLAAHRKGKQIEVMEIGTSLEKQEEDHLKSTLKVIPVRELGEELIHG